MALLTSAWLPVRRLRPAGVLGAPPAQSPAQGVQGWRVEHAAWLLGTVRGPIFGGYSALPQAPGLTLAHEPNALEETGGLGRRTWLREHRFPGRQSEMRNGGMLSPGGGVLQQGAGGQEPQAGRCRVSRLILRSGEQNAPNPSCQARRGR